MELREFHRESGEWLAGSGTDSDIVISSRVRLARNLAGFRFPSKAREDEKEEVVEIVSGVIRDTKLAQLRFVSQYHSLEDEAPLDRMLMVERRLISKEHAHAKGARSVAFDPNETASVMINEEDHIRIQVLRSGLDLEGAWSGCAAVDDALGSRLRYAFDTRLGFLTTCPTNVGTGIRVSAMLHLPAIAMIDHIGRVKEAGAELDLTVRGLYGEGSRAHGDFFQISNQVTLGKTEDDLIQAVQSVIPSIVGWEHRARKDLLSKRRSPLEDKIWRSYGLLSSARRITSDEALDCLSSVRMGIALKLIEDIPLETVNQLFLHSQPAHLQKLAGRDLDAEGRDSARAHYIRERLSRN